LTPEEYEAARASTLNAHYTTPLVIKAVYDVIERMGFTTGNILEPSCGIGNFFGLLPDKMKKSNLYGVELDSITGRIAQQLYPDATIQIKGFEKTKFPNDYFDIAVGNVPFGSYHINDPNYNKLGFTIHNYFLAKSLDKVRPGGIVAMLTSRYTMDAKSPEVRKYLAERAELLGAVRLPQGTFKANAGTEVVIDILFLQKRERPVIVEPDWVHLGQTEDGFTVNNYFIQHPEMVLGKHAHTSTQYERESYTVEPFMETDLSQQLSEIIPLIKGQIPERNALVQDESEINGNALSVNPDVKNYSFTVVDGEVYFRENDKMNQPKLPKTSLDRIKGMIELRDCVRKLIDLQMDDAVSDAAIKQEQAHLNKLYDAYTEKYGLINDKSNRQAFSADSSYYLLCSLEVMDENGKLKRKADMFSKRTIQKHVAATHVDTASEALAVSIGECARVDLSYMSQLTGKSEKELVHELRGVLFRVPNKEENGKPVYQTADEYLSGMVRVKLREAQKAAETDPAFAINVEALTAAQPKDLDASEIEVRLGATWIDKKYYQQFMYEVFDTPFYLQAWGYHQTGRIELQYSPYTANWWIENKTKVPSYDISAYTTFGTPRASAYYILEESLNLRDVRIYDTVTDENGKDKRVLNAKETTLAAQKQQAIRDAFREWIRQNPERRQALVKQYNEEMNGIRPREYDGSHIIFGGMNPEISLRTHQRNAVAHVLYGGNTLLAHEVGAGKTFEMIAAAMESKRLGLCKKSVFVVPNHLTEQWSAEFLRLYPAANILVTTKKDFEKNNRKKCCARIATGDYDGG